MKRLVVCLAVFALLPQAAACGGHVRQSVTVRGVPLLQFHDREISTFALSTTGKPSGVIAFKSVQNGRVETLGSLRFDNLEGAGSAAVEVTGRAIEACWNLPMAASPPPGSPVALPVGSTVAPTGSRGDRTMGATGPTGEQVLWIQIRVSGEQPAGINTGWVAGDFTSVVSTSKQQPAETAYCLTLEVDGQ